KGSIIESKEDVPSLSDLRKAKEEIFDFQELKEEDSVAFPVLHGPEAGEEVLTLAENSPQLAEFLDTVPEGFLLPMENLGAGGMFVGMISAIIAVEIYRWSMVKGIRITMPEQVPPSVARSFEALIPTE